MVVTIKTIMTMVIVCNNLFLDQQKSNIYIIGKILSTHFLMMTVTIVIMNNGEMGVRGREG